MELRPQTPTDTEPSYPARRAGRLGLGGRLRRLAAAAGLALALGAGGCTLLAAEPEEWELAGGMEAPHYFACADVQPPLPSTNLMSPNGFFDGQLCGDQTAWGQLDVVEPVTVTADFSAGEGGAVAAFISPEGIEAFELRTDLPATTFHLPAGLWTIAVTAMTPDDLGWFSLSFSPP